MTPPLTRSSTSPFRGLFVTGTDTGVGKTLVALALVRELRARGLDVGAMKPIETGVGDEGPSDALALREAAGSADALEDVCPQRFTLPAAPAAAARAEGREVDLDAVRAAYSRLAARHDCIIAEGAGGLLVPLTRAASIAELARDLRLPLVVSARGRLGTINHTLLTLDAARSRKLSVAGVVVSHTEGHPSAAEARNLELLREALGSLLVGEIPHLAAGREVPRSAIDLDALLRNAVATLPIPP
jgi:dethiobiotin synthetase